MPVPVNPKIYHIVHVDRLSSIIKDGWLWCDAEILRRNPTGTTIGMNKIKERRLKLPLPSNPDLHVGDCVPRSIMLYLIHKANHPELIYRGGQEPIIHLEADLNQTIKWAEQHERRWAFTLANAGAFYFEDRRDLNRLDEINWDAVQTDRWSGRDIPDSVKESKQAEFLMERSFPWELISRVGVSNRQLYGQVYNIVQTASHQPRIEIKSDWYY
jgi:hypothetical protein